MLNNLYTWLFTEEERSPVSFIGLFFLMILVSTVVCLFIISVSKHVMWI